MHQLSFMSRQKVRFSSGTMTFLMEKWKSTCRESTDHNLAVVCHSSLWLPALLCCPVWWFMKSNRCLPLLMFPGCCSSSALQCLRPSELAGTHSYGPDRDASVSASTGQCLWEESCWKGAIGVTREKPWKEEKRVTIVLFTTKTPIYQLWLFGQSNFSK